MVLALAPSRALPAAIRAAAETPHRLSSGSLLVQFDDAWLRYLDQFVAWKGADAASLEVRVCGRAGVRVCGCAGVRAAERAGVREPEGGRSA